MPRKKDSANHQPVSAVSTALEHLTVEELRQKVEELQEEVRMRSAWSGSSEAGNSDAVLHWLGRSRILAERVPPVGLKPVEKASFQPLKGDHRIIEGDNLAVMTSLLTEFRGGPNRGIDVVYFDPPYNTGQDIFSYSDTGQDIFSYSDKYNLSKGEVKALRRKLGRAEGLVSLDDPTRHTKWINHMAPRLWAARKLLKTTGVIIVSIDEHELPRLWMLMEELFGERNRIATLVWERARKNDASYVSEGHEYMLIWARNKAELDAKRSKMAGTLQWGAASGKWRKRKEGVDAILTAYADAKGEHGADIPAIQKALDAFFAALPADHPARKIRYKKVNKLGVYNDDGNPNWPGGNGPRYAIPHPKTGKPVKIPANGWVYQKPEMMKLIAEGRVAFKADHKGTPRLITYLHEMETQVQTSVISKSGQRAVESLEAILGKGAFKNPKDPEILSSLFNLVTWRDHNAVVLDAYAGSGTTGEAVINMNAEDNGKRRFILIENGDPRSSAVERAKYTTKITAERIRRVITGKWSDKKPHATHRTGFLYFRAQDEITKSAIMAATRERLADIILQIVEDDSNRIDCRVEGHRHLIGRTKLGYGIALVWLPNKPTSEQVLTWAILEKLLAEAAAANVLTPVHVYASANSAPLVEELYRFHQIPNAILARLGVLDVDGDDDPE